MASTNANPQTINILPGNSGTGTGTITATAHASYMQRVVLKIQGSPGGVQTITFQGSGEGTNHSGVPMKTLNGGETTYNMQSWNLPIVGTAEFSYSEDGGTKWTDNTAKNCTLTSSGNGGTIKVVTEDSTDNDDNDTVLKINTTVD